MQSKNTDYVGYFIIAVSTALLNLVSTVSLQLNTGVVASLSEWNFLENYWKPRAASTPFAVSYVCFFIFYRLILAYDRMLIQTVLQDMTLFGHKTISFNGNGIRQNLSPNDKAALFKVASVISKRLMTLYGIPGVLSSISYILIYVYITQFIPPIPLSVALEFGIIGFGWGCITGVLLLHYAHSPFCRRDIIKLTRSP